MSVQLLGSLRHRCSGWADHRSRVALGSKACAGSIRLGLVHRRVVVRMGVLILRFWGGPRRRRRFHRGSRRLRRPPRRPRRRRRRLASSSPPAPLSALRLLRQSLHCRAASSTGRWSSVPNAADGWSPSSASGARGCVTRRPHDPRRCGRHAGAACVACVRRRVLRLDPDRHYRRSQRIPAGLDGLLVILILCGLFLDGVVVFSFLFDSRCGCNTLGRNRREPGRASVPIRPFRSGTVAAGSYRHPPIRVIVIWKRCSRSRRWPRL